MKKKCEKDMKKIGFRVRNTFPAVLAVIVGLLVPGIVLAAQEKNERNHVEKVPTEYYSAANSLIAQNASAKLSMEERLQLVTGAWESEITSANSAEMGISMLEAVDLVHQEIAELQKKGLYPAIVGTGYQNWYCYNGVAYKAVDSIFHTYAVYYWEIELEKYDRSEVHVVRIMEDGTIFYAELRRGGEKVYEYHIENW